MITAEYREAREHVDEFLARPNARQDHLTVNEKVVERAKELIRGPSGKKIDREESYRWIHSGKKEKMERAIFGLLSLLTHPLILAERGYVYVSDGSPTIHLLPVGFLGNGNEIISPIKMPKIRTLPVNAREREEPFMSSLFRPRNGDGSLADGRPFSGTALIFRVGSIDELPELYAIRQRLMAGFGPRGLYDKELRDGRWLYIVHDHDGGILPPEVPADCREVTSTVKPRQSLVGPYSALGRKELNFATRQALNHLMMTEENPAGNVRIFRETVKEVFARIGAG